MKHLNRLNFEIRNYVQPYHFLASLYDQDWGDFTSNYQPLLNELNQQFGFAQKKILDLACGTGNLALILAEMGATVFGLDRSRAMLQTAYRKCPEKRIYLIQGDMRQVYFKPGSFDFIFCTFDSINYLVEPGEIDLFFRASYEQLKPRSLFIFDINTIHAFGLRHMGTFRRLIQGIHFIQKHFFDEKKCLEITTFTFPDGTETHTQRGYQKAEIDTLLYQNHFSIQKCLKAFQFTAGDDDSERLIYMVQKESL